MSCGDVHCSITGEVSAVEELPIFQHGGFFQNTHLQTQIMFLNNRQIVFLSPSVQPVPYRYFNPLLKSIPSSTSQRREIAIRSNHVYTASYILGSGKY